MNATTGIIYDIPNGMNLSQFAESTGMKPADMIPVARHPDGTCKKCNGTGRKRAGLFSRRFKPCDCVL